MNLKLQHDSRQGDSNRSSKVAVGREKEIGNKHHELKSCSMKEE